MVISEDQSMQCLHQTECKQEALKSHIIGKNVTVIQPTVQTIRVFQTTGDGTRKEKKENRVKTARKHLHEQQLQASISTHKVNVTYV